MRTVKIATALCIYACIATYAGFAFAQVQKQILTNATPTHEWLAQAPRAEAQARITNLKPGDTVESPFVVKFGMSHWGIAPAEHDHAMTGHHHLLVDAPLPIPLDVPIAFSDNYRHFGKGQMEVVLDLAPGKHSLQLLLANHKHIPFFVYSNAVNVMVSARNPNALPADYGKKPKLEILSPKDAEEHGELLQVVFHASGLNVAHAATKLDGTGYFRLSIAHERRANVENIAFHNGLTEAWLKLPKGKVRFQLSWVKNPKGDLHEVKSEWVKVTVR